MKQVLNDVLIPAVTLAISSAVVSIFYWVAIVYLLGFSVTYLQVYGAMLLVDMTFNKLSNQF